MSKATKRNQEKVTNMETAPVVETTETPAEEIQKPVKKEKIVSEPVEEFVSQKLHMIADRLFRYDCENSQSIKKEFFHSDAAKMFGLRKGDLVMLVDAESTKNIVV